MNWKIILPFIIIPILLMGGVAIFTKIQNEKNHHVVQSHRSYSLEVIQKIDPNQIVLNEPTTIRYKIKDDKGEIVKNFAVTHEKLMHFIVVRKDLMQYQHLHPKFDKETGEFSVDVVFTVDGPYRLFADFTPGDTNPDKIPVTVHTDMAVGDVSNFQPHAVTSDTQTAKTVPPDYVVMYEFPDKLKSEIPVSFNLTVEQNNEPITLEPYLGALGHTVILKEGTLDYIHTHAGEHSDAAGHGEHEMTNDNEISFSTTFPSSGKYKMFTEFQHDGNVSIVDYTVEMK